MLNVQDHYTYKNKSINKVHNGSIHALSDRSLNEYISNSSHVSRFLDKTKLIKSKNFNEQNFTENNEENFNEINNNFINKKNNRNSSNVFFNDFEKDYNKISFDSQENRKSMLNQLNQDKSFVKLIGRYNTSNNKKGSKIRLLGLGKESGFNPISNFSSNEKNHFNENNNNNNLKNSNNQKMSLDNLYDYSNNDNSINLKAATTCNNFKKLSNNFNKGNCKNDNDQNQNYNPISSMNLNVNNQSAKANFQNKYSSISTGLNPNKNIPTQKLLNEGKNNQVHLMRSNSIDVSLNNNIINNTNNNFKSTNNINNNDNSGGSGNINSNNFSSFKNSKPSLNHDGFSLNNIPRVDSLYTMSDPKFLNFSHTNFHCKKIINSLHMSNNLKVKDEMQKTSKIEVRKLNKAKNPKDFVEKLCDLENSKYGRIFNMQRSKDFLDPRQLPEIKFEKKNVDVTNNFYNAGNSKFMGVNYNPFNYDLFASKNRTKRNVFGTLFIN